MRKIQYLQKAILLAFCLMGFFALSATASAAINPEQAETYSQILFKQKQALEYKDAAFAKLLDFNHDGVDELLTIVGQREGYDYSVLCSVWGMQNGKVEHLGSYEEPIFTSLLTHYFKEMDGKTYLLIEAKHGDLGSKNTLCSINSNGTWGMTEATHLKYSNPAENERTYTFFAPSTQKAMTEKEYETLTARYLSGAIPFMHLSFDSIREGNFILNTGYENTWEKTSAYVLECTKQVSAERVTMNAKVDGVEKRFEAYAIKNNNYIKLRDLAYVLNGTKKQFSIAWDQGTGRITLRPGQAYQPLGGEMTLTGKSGSATLLENKPNLYLNEERIEVAAYQTEGNNYIKLRDLASYLDIGVTWDESSQSVGIDTNAGHTALQVLRSEDSKTAAGMAKRTEEKHLETWMKQYPKSEISFSLTDDFDYDGTFETFLGAQILDDSGMMESKFCFVKTAQIIDLGEIDITFDPTLLISEQYQYKHLVVMVNAGSGTAEEDMYAVKNGQPVREMGGGLQDKAGLTHQLYSVRDGYLVEYIGEEKENMGAQVIVDHEVLYQWDAKQQKYVQISTEKVEG